MSLIDQQLPSIPSKRYFTISETSGLCEVKPHVLRYWEEEIESLNPKKNKSGQRLYQKKDVELVFEIKQLLYAEKFTIAGARKKLKQNCAVQFATGKLENGIEVTVGAMSFSFLGASVGIHEGNTILAGIDHAIKNKTLLCI